MDKVLKIVSLRSKNSDFDFWQSKSYQDRLAAIELLREQYIKLQKNVQPRLQRVCRVIKQS